MAEQKQTSLTYERILELFQETAQKMDRMAQEANRRMQELKQQMERTDRQIERTSKEISSLGSRVGQIVENMVGGDIVEQFRTLGYDVVRIARNVEFGKDGTSASGEIDLLLEDGDVAILIEAKTTPKVDDVLDHIERLEKFRSHVNRDGNIDKRHFIGAIAGATVKPNVIKFAQSKGLYVIVQTGRVVEIVPTPEGFQAKKW